MFHVAENQPSGSHVGFVSAVDRDASPRDQFAYVIDRPFMTSPVGGGFRVDAATGHIVTTKPLDRERQKVYHLSVLCTSGFEDDVLVVAVEREPAGLPSHGHRSAYIH